MSDSLITSEVDFDADGKHNGFLRLPHSVHRSAYGWIPIPIVMIKNGDGPTALLISGNHGDEFEGQVALTKRSTRQARSSISGRPTLPAAGPAQALTAAAGPRSSITAPRSRTKRLGSPPQSMSEAVPVSVSTRQIVA